MLAMRQLFANGELIKSHFRRLEKLPGACGAAISGAALVEATSYLACNYRLATTTNQYKSVCQSVP